MSATQNKETNTKKESKPVVKEDPLFDSWMKEMGELGKMVEEYVQGRNLGANTERALLKAAIKPFYFFKQESIPKIDGGSGGELPLAKGPDNTLLAVKHMMKRDCPSLYEHSRIELVSKGDYSFVRVEPDGWTYTIDEFKRMCAIARQFGSDWDKRYRNWGIPVKE